MNKQPEALRLAAEMTDDIPGCPGLDDLNVKAATELRRLHELNAELLFALKNLLDAKNGISAIFDSDEIACKAITKAEGEKL